MTVTPEEKPRIRARWVLLLIALVLASVLASLVALSPGARTWGASKPASVTASLYYQSIPPYYLRQRFQTAPRGEATGNLWLYAGRLNVNAPGSPLREWKLRVSGAARPVR